MAAPGATGLSSDARSLESLRIAAGKDPRTASREVARQFESLFMQEMLKSMRAATQSSGLLDNQGTQLGTEMLDAQYANAGSCRPGGLADLIARQLDQQMALTPGPIPSTTPANTSLPLVSPPDQLPQLPQKSAAGFVQQHQQEAQAAEAASGIPATFMLAQAAHETGWGKKEIIGSDGTPSHNLFGIKAGPGWNGPTVDVTTTEYRHGRPQKVVQSFRAYGSFAESFQDYAQLLSQSPRYAGVMAARGDARAFAAGLQSAGYATDPAYAAKLGRVIETTQRLQRRLG